LTRDDALEGFNATFLTPAAALTAMRARVAAEEPLGPRPS